MGDEDIIVSLRDVTKIYGHHKALDGVSFDLRRGEVHCLVGENGAGKSTLIKILSGAIAPDRGEICIAGQCFRFLTPRQAIELGVSTVYQDAELVDSLTVADNVFLGNEQSARLSFVVDKKVQLERAREIIATLRLPLEPATLVENLSASQRQMLQITKALYREARVIIMDEPTSSLGLEEKEALMRIIRTLRERGIGIIYISHYLEEIFEIGDRVTVLKDGSSMGTYRIQDVTLEEVVRKMVGRDASAFFHRRAVPLGEVQFEVRGLTRKGLVDDVSFSVREGEIFGIGGLVGSGRSELVNLIFGSIPLDGGEVRLRGKKCLIRSPREAIRHGIALIPEDRRKLAMLLGRNLVENASLVHNDLFRGMVVRHREEVALTRDIIQKLAVATQSETQLIEELSGGNQQKMVIGRWLPDTYSVYIFDEPTKGVDIGAKERIYELMVELAEKGKSIIMISSSMPELLSMSDRIGIMRAGRMVDIVESRSVTEEDLIRAFIGV
ncbi:MAG: sugar ABC transporter ATP-binding protein [Candidatus Atribacteria bacterium]|nr:sugar ABC transporter ATP-binding protein [Candidatus Atribacteria bacterium]